MLSPFWQRVDQGIRTILPFLTTLLFVLVGVVPWPLPFLGPIAPAFVLIALYYWAVHRPDLFQASHAFVIGLFYDALTDLPLGLSAFVFVGLYQMALVQRRFFVGHSFLMLWLGFAVTMSLSMVTFWILVSLIRWQAVPIVPVFLQGLLTFVVFPVPARLLIAVQRATGPSQSEV